MPLTHGNDLMLGVDARNRPIRMSADQRSRHLYVVGSSGSGKSRLLKSLLQQDIDGWRRSACGLMLIDLHGELYQQVMGWVASQQLIYRKRPIIPMDFTRPEHVVSYNLLRKRQGEPTTAISELVEAIAYAQGQDSAQETPRFTTIVSAALNALAARGLSIAEIFDVLAPGNGVLREHLIQGMPSEAVHGLLWLQSLPPKEISQAVESTYNRVQKFLNNPNIGRMLGQTGASFDFLEAMEEGAIVLVNLASKGNQISEADGQAMATVLLADAWSAAKERGKTKIRGQSPKPFYLYLDEFQHFITPTIAKNLDEARGFGLHLTLAHQFPSQLSGEGPRGKRLLDSVINNVSSKIVMHLGAPKEYMPLVECLFTGELDAHKVKHDIYTRSVIAERETTRRVTTTGKNSTKTVGESESESSSYTDSSGTSRGRGIGYSYNEYLEDGDSYEFFEPGGDDDVPDRWRRTETENEGDTEGWSSSDGTSNTVSRSTAEGTSHSVSIVPHVERQYAERLSSRSFQSVDEQFFEKGQRIFRLKHRQAIIRLDDEDKTRAMTTLNVSDTYVTAYELEQYRLRCLNQWDFVLEKSAAEAAKELRRNWAEKLIAPPQEEPQEFTNRRRMKSREE